MARPKEPREGIPVTVRGKHIPFTLWPDNYLTYGSLVSSNCWQLMSSFVSSGAEDKYCSIEHSNTSILRAKSYIEQSRLFYLASQQASMETAPLMLYYSCLNLTNAFLIRRGRIKDEKQIHGLRLKTPIRRYRDLTTVKCTVADTWSNNAVSVFRELIQECRFTPPVNGQELSLQDMLYQVVGIHDAFVITKQKGRMFFPIELQFLKPKDGKTVWVHAQIDTTEFTRTQHTVLCDFIENNKLFNRVSSSGKPNTFVLESVAKAKYSRSPMEVLRKKLVEPIRKYIYCEQTPTGFQYYLCCTDKFTAQVASHFAVLFMLGMVVRYVPEIIDKLLSDWLVHEYLTTQPIQFIYLLGSGLVHNEIIPFSISA